MQGEPLGNVRPATILLFGVRAFHRVDIHVGVVVCRHSFAIHYLVGRLACMNRDPPCPAGQPTPVEDRPVEAQDGQVASRSPMFFTTVALRVNRYRVRSPSISTCTDLPAIRATCSNRDRKPSRAARSCILGPQLSRSN